MTHLLLVWLFVTAITCGFVYLVMVGIDDCGDPEPWLCEVDR
jgi:hypothetical protein